LLPLLLDDLPLGVELPEDRTAEPVRLQPHPQFEPVRGHSDGVHGQVIAGARVEAVGAGVGVDRVQMGGNHVLPLLLLELQDLLSQFPNELQVSPNVLVHLGAQALRQGVLTLHQRRLCRVVSGADGLCAFEHEMLVEVRQAGRARSFVRRPGLDPQLAGDQWDVVPLDNHDLHAVAEGGLLHVQCPRPCGGCEARQDANQGCPLPGRTGCSHRSSLLPTVTAFGSVSR